MLYILTTSIDAQCVPCTIVYFKCYSWHFKFLLPQAFQNYQIKNYSPVGSIFLCDYKSIYIFLKDLNSAYEYYILLISTKYVVFSLLLSQKSQ